MRIRLIIQSNDNGNREFVTFTEEFDTPVDDFKFPDCSIDFDKVIEAEIPSVFPTGYNLQRQS